METKQSIPVWLFVLTVLTIFFANVTSWVFYGDSELAARSYARWTAHIAYCIFLVAFLASPMAHSVPNRLTKWILANRRFWGLNFALAHTIHLGAVVMVMVVTDQMPDLIAIIFGGFAYVLIWTMAATSTDKSQRRLGKWWTRLHSFGGYYIWFIFAYTYAGSIFQSQLSVFFLIVALAAIGFKIQDKTTPARDAA